MKFISAMFTLVLVQVACVRQNLSQQLAEDSASGLALLFQAYYWEHGRLPTGLPDIQPQLDAGELAVDVPKGVDLSWKQVHNSQARTASVTFMFRERERVIKIDHIIPLFRGTQSWRTLEVYDKNAGRYVGLRHPLNFLHMVAQAIYLTWKDSGHLPAQAVDARQSLELTAPSGFALSDVKLKRVSSIPPGVSFQLTFDGYAVTYRFKDAVRDPSDFEPTIEVVKPRAPLPSPL